MHVCRVCYAANVCVCGVSRRGQLGAGSPHYFSFFCLFCFLAAAVSCLYHTMIQALKFPMILCGSHGTTAVAQQGFV